MIVQIRKRSKWGRIKRLPKLIKFNWKFASNANFIDRVIHVYSMIKIVMR